MAASEHSEPEAAPWAAGETPADDAATGDAFAERPEIYVGAAFAGGLALAAVLRVMGR